MEGNEDDRARGRHRDSSRGHNGDRGQNRDQDSYRDRSPRESSSRGNGDMDKHQQRFPRDSSYDNRDFRGSNVRDSRGDSVRGDRNGRGNGFRGRGRGDGRGRGGGRGRGRGRGRGGSSAPPRPEPPPAIQFDFVKSKPEGCEKISRATVNEKQLEPQNLITNYFRMEFLQRDWSLYLYRVDFKPNDLDDKTDLKKHFVKQQAKALPPYLFDGSSLFCAAKLETEPLILYTDHVENREKYELTFKFVKELPPGDVTYIQVYNILIRECLRRLKLEELGRNFYDAEKEIQIPEYNLALWPGFLTSIRHHENHVLLNVEITHKVLRTVSVLDVLKTKTMEGFNQRQIKAEFLNTIFLTQYNRKTYKMDDIDFSKTPMSTFKCRGQEKTFSDYIWDQYKLRVTDLNQPLLMSRPKKKDVHGGKPKPGYFIPEFCRMTGISSDMRKNFNLMRALSDHLQKPPDKRVDVIKGFMKRLLNTEETAKELSHWQISFSPDLEKVEGKVLPLEDIKFAENVAPDARGEWELKNVKVFKSVPLTKWVIIVPQSLSSATDDFIENIRFVSKNAGLDFKNPPLEIYKIPGSRPDIYTKEIENVVATYGTALQLICFIVPNHKPIDVYRAIKMRLCCDYGIPSQCVTERNIGKNLKSVSIARSIATKIAIQMCAKLGGIPWSISIPLKTMMVIGFDIYHSANRQKKSIGAMVCTTSSDYGNYFHCASAHTNREMLSNNMSQDVSKCLHAYRTKNNRLPDRILFYRDGVGDGQLTFVFETELRQIKTTITDIYSRQETEPAKLSFIVVTKKIKSRIITADYTNPVPGTLVDDVITLPERYDFFLISQSAKQGTVSPTSYNILHDEQKLSAYKMQRISYKLCHMYYNWNGTVSVPAPCQYAKKLAYLSGQFLEERDFSDKLSHLLFYL